MANIQVAVEIGSSELHCDPECFLTVYPVPTFTTPTEVIEGEQNCVDYFNPHPDVLASSYQVFIGGVSQANV